MEAEEIRYDEEADILYIWSRNPEEVGDTVSEETGEEILIDREAETGEVVGFTIMNFSKREDVEKGLSLGEEVSVQA